MTEWHILSGARMGDRPGRCFLHKQHQECNGLFPHGDRSELGPFELVSGTQGGAIGIRYTNTHPLMCMNLPLRRALLMVHTLLSRHYH